MVKSAGGFREHTIRHAATKTREQKKTLGQYFTPAPVRRLIIEALEKQRFVPQTVLEPSCGTGEFVLDILEKYENARITAIELDPETFQAFQQQVAQEDRVMAICDDFLKPRGGGAPASFDLVIGNPPYFFVGDAYDKHPYAQRKAGKKTNIFELFIFQSYYLLNDGGYLAFVVPKSIMTTTTFCYIREFIDANFDISEIIDHRVSSIFEEASQNVVSLILKKKPTNRFVLNLPHRTLFFADPDYKKRMETLLSLPTLDQLGFSVSTGNVVWNQHKDKLTNAGAGNTVLLYAHNIGPDGIVLPEDGAAGTKKRKLFPGKEQYLISDSLATNPLCGPAILVNRIVGIGGALKSCLIRDPEFRFYAENHVNVIRHRDNDLDTLVRLQAFFKSEPCQQVIEAIMSSTQLSKYELQHLIPADLNIE